jgi:hypothetical protein
MRRVRALVLHARPPGSETLSYQSGWPREFRQHPRFHCAVVDVLDRRAVELLRLRLRVRPRFDAVLVLHSVFSNTCYLKGALFEQLCGLDVPKAFFIGNEYKHMPIKMEFADDLGVALLVSQITHPLVLDLYRERLGCAVVGLPNTGIDTRLFAPRIPDEERPIDLGYRAHESPLYLGHNERRELADRFVEAAARDRLKVDISLDAADRFTESEWAGFLNRCKGQIGSEAGGDFFELTDETRFKEIEFEKAHPGATFDEIYERFFRHYPNPVPGRALSGRIVESAGTKTAQILLEGEYAGYFQPDVHYIPLRKDFSNVDEAIEKFRDEGIRRTVAENAYLLAVEELTYERLIDRFHRALAPFIGA